MSVAQSIFTALEEQRKIDTKEQQMCQQCVDIYNAHESKIRKILYSGYKSKEKRIILDYEAQIQIKMILKSSKTGLHDVPEFFEALSFKVTMTNQYLLLYEKSKS